MRLRTSKRDTLYIIKSGESFDVSNFCVKFISSAEQMNHIHAAYNHPRRENVKKYLEPFFCCLHIFGMLGYVAWLQTRMLML